MARPALALLVEATEPGALNLCRAFREAGHEVTLLNRSAKPAEGDTEVLELGRPSAVHDVYPLPRWRRERVSYLLNSAGHKLGRAHLGTLAQPLLVPAFDLLLARPVQDRLVQLVKDSGAEIVYGYWGIASLPEQRALQLAKAPQAQVHHFQTYPLGKARYADPKPASPIERVTLGRLDGRIHASEEMDHYLNAALRPARGVDQILPEAFGSWACAGRQRQPKLREGDGVLHVVHIGTTPLTPGHADDVAPQLDAMALEGLAVHAVEGFLGPRLKNFRRLGLRALLTGEVASFLTQFDAVVLPLNAPKGLQWFAGNFSMRFLSGLSAGVPLCVPRGLYGAMQRFVEQHGNGFVYDDAKDLARQLRDETALKNATNAALALEREHRLDRLLPRYQQFLSLVLDHRGNRGPAASTADASATLK